MERERAELERLRTALDACNTELCAALMRRAAVVREVARLKARAGIAPLDREREEHMLRAVHAAGSDLGFSGDALVRIFRAVLTESQALVLERARAERDGPERQ